MSLSDSALVRSGLEHLSISFGEVNEAEVCFLNSPVCIGKRAGVVSDPLAELSLILDRGGRVGGGDHIEPRCDGPVRPTFRLACVMRRENQQLAGPALTDAFEALPQELGPGLRAAREIRTADRLHEEKITSQREPPPFVGDERDTAERVP